MQRSEMRFSFIPRVLFFLCFPTFLFSQSGDVSVSPGILYRGQQTQLSVRFADNILAEGIENIAIDPEDIRVTNYHIISTREIILNVQVNENAGTGYASLKLTTGQREVRFGNFIEIVPIDQEVEIFLNILPVKKIYFSDIDPFDMVNAPELFSALVFNDHIQKDLTFEFVIVNEKFGLVRRGIKEIKSVKPNQQIILNYTDFDIYPSTEISSSILNYSQRTGYLPFGKYTYTLRVFDEDGYLLRSETSSIYLENDWSNLELTGPGNTLDQSPDIIYTRFPRFQWFGDAYQYTVTIYEVGEHQRTPDEIITNLPVHEAAFIRETGFLYPAYADMLEKGKIYAWQVTAEFQSSHGLEKQFSEVRWFQLNTSDPDISKDLFDRIVIVPGFQELSINNTLQLKAHAVTTNNDTFEIECEWRIVPSNFAFIDQSGLLRTGSKPGHIAVVAEYSGLKTYATIRILENE